MENLLRLPGLQPTRGAFSVQVLSQPVTEIGVSLSTSQVAGQLGISDLDVRRLIARNELAASVVADRYHVEAEDLKACMRAAKRWSVPADLGTVDYNAERRVRERFLAAAQRATSNDLVLAEMRRLVRPGQPLETIGAVSFQFNSAPGDFLARLAEPTTTREMGIRIRGEAEQPQQTLAFAYAKSRLYAAANRIQNQQLTLKGGFAGYLYSNQQVYRELIAAMIDRVQSELLSCKETRILEVKRSEVTVGSETQIVLAKIPVVVSYTIPTSALDSVLRIARTANEVF